MVSSDEEIDKVKELPRDPEEYKQVLVQLGDAMEEYAGGAGKILITAEETFMNAYDGHMRKVYKDMDVLIHKAERNKSLNLKH